MDEGLTQLAVMMLDSGEWKLLTTNRDRGLLLSMAWSRTGTEIYYDRATGVPHGIFRISTYGADDRMILENASLPQVLVAPLDLWFWPAAVLDQPPAKWSWFQNVMRT